ncbi:MAG TPA: hypothetical protein VF799_00005, partial [Geobacteraceae bacterium]
MMGLVKRLFLAEATRLGEFFTAYVSGNTKDLPGSDASGIAYLVPVRPVKEWPERLVIVDIRLSGDLRECFAMRDQMVNGEWLLAVLPAPVGL